VAGGREELVIEMYVTAKIVEIEEVGERGGNERLSGVNLLVIVPNIVLSSVIRFKGVRDPVLNWCLELISLRVTLPRLGQMTE
jgi:hypothetical protein